jgi:glycerophosphoryl diester phosphodiesterase
MKRFLLVTLLLSVVWSLSAQDKALAYVIISMQEGNNSVLVVSHRADWRNAPENSLQAIRNCIEMGVDMVEIDLKKPKTGI